MFERDEVLLNTSFFKCNPKFAILFLYAIYSIIAVEGLTKDDRFAYVCSTSKSLCSRTNYFYVDKAEVYPTIELCRLVCGKYGALWPKPSSINISNRNLLAFNPSQVTIVVNPTNNDQMSSTVVNIFRNNLKREYNNCQRHKETKVHITITLSSNIKQLDWNTDESYSLSLDAVNDTQVAIDISASNIFGGRHGLETLSQLITSYPETDGTTCLAMVKGVKIYDKPVYRHRGVLLDSSRNFQSLSTIKYHIQAMGASKMNFLHWHITDSHSFPMESPRVPNMTVYGAYSPSKIYKYEDIKGIIQYALNYGVRVVLELDAPSHAGYGWQWGPEKGLGNLTVCLNHQPWRQACIQPPCGQLNPANRNVYDVIQQIYSDIVGLLPWSKIFHMGGDELFIPCWNSTPEIIKYLGNKPRTTETFLDLWAEFQKEALKRYDIAVGNTNSQIIIWTSHLTDPAHIENYLDKTRYVIQTWVPSDDDLPDQLLQMGYNLIISTKNAWYLDHGFWGNTQYYDWRKVYANEILLSPNVLGGEVCMWGEYVDDSAVISRTWPRAAAAAERLWSNPDLETYQVEARFYRHRERLVTRDIKADAVIPRWCYYNEGQC